MEVNEVIEKLEEYIELSNDEVSDQLECMIRLYRNSDGLTASLVEELENHMREALDWYEESTEIIEKTETVTRTYTTLEHL